ncbi:MAG: hypothetical protein MJ204_01900 [Bacteroidales bacterium]|nr:hypothetical protein [Bacteroidales bacterium]
MTQNAQIAFEELKSKISILKSMYSVAKSQNEQLKRENNELKQQLEKQQNSIVELEQKVTNLQLAKAVSDSSGTDDNSARKYIEGIIREIDSCIALLNK